MAMRIAALLESSRHSCVEHHLRPVALQAGEWERKCVRARTSHGPQGGCGGSAARCGARLQHLKGRAHAIAAGQRRSSARAGASISKVHLQHAGYQLDGPLTGSGGG